GQQRPGTVGGAELHQVGTHRRVHRPPVHRGDPPRATAADLPAHRRREGLPRRPRLRLGQGRTTTDLGHGGRELMTTTKTGVQTPTETPGRKAGRPERGRGPKFPTAFYMMVLPALVLFFVFHTIPVLQGIYYSFTDSPGYGPSN